MWLILFWWWNRWDERDPPPPTWDPGYPPTSLGPRLPLRFIGWDHTMITVWSLKDSNWIVSSPIGSFHCCTVRFLVMFLLVRTPVPLQAVPTLNAPLRAGTTAVVVVVRIWRRNQTQWLIASKNHRASHNGPEIVFELRHKRSWDWAKPHGAVQEGGSVPGGGWGFRDRMSP